MKNMINLNVDSLWKAAAFPVGAISGMDLIFFVPLTITGKWERQEEDKK